MNVFAPAAAVASQQDWRGQPQPSSACHAASAGALAVADVEQARRGNRPVSCELLAIGR
jgi:hypothetical protein